MPPSGKTEVYVKLRVEKDFSLDDSDEVIAFSLYVYITTGSTKYKIFARHFSDPQAERNDIQQMEG